MGQERRGRAEPGADPLRAALRACRPHVAFVILFSAALNLLYLAPSLYMLQVYDRVIATGGVMTLVFLSLVLVGCLLALAFLDATRARLLAAAARRLDRLLAPAILAAPFQRSPLQGARSDQPVRELDVLRAAMTGPAALAVLDVPWTPIYVAIAFVIHPWLGVLATGGAVALLAVALVNELALRRARHAEDASPMYALQQGDAVHAETARALGMQETLIARQREARAAALTAQDRAARRGATFTAATKFLRLALQSAALGLGALLAVQQEISVGAVIACTILTARAFAPIEQVVAAWRQFGQASRAFKILSATLADLAPQRAFTELPGVRGALSVERATVIAPSREQPLVQGASLRVAPGEIVGVIGPSGGGKSTLMRAIVGAVGLHDGVVRLDGAQLSDFPPDKLGRLIGYMPQTPSLFAGTIAQNIARFDTPGADIDRAIMRAAEQAGVHDLILHLPNGYDTEIGADGRGLSAGQAQRVALARALYGDPVLVVLDEPNAHVDAEGETALVNALKSTQARAAAIIVVAHRAGFMSIADKLLVLRDGRVEAFGPTNEVMQKLAAAGAPRPAVGAPPGQAGGRP